MRVSPLLFCLFLHFLTLASAAPPSSSETSTRTVSSTTSSSRSRSSRPPQAQSTRTRVHSIPVLTPPTFLTRTRGTPPPVRTREPDPFSRPLHHRRSGQTPIAVVFEVLGGLAATAVFFSVLRCFYKYRKTPERDRIAEVLHRHNLQREMDELERNPLAIRRPSLREPAPPYFPRPPSYEDSPTAPFGSAVSRSEYSDVATHSPPSSPLESRTTLPSPNARSSWPD